MGRDRQVRDAPVRELLGGVPAPMRSLRNQSSLLKWRRPKSAWWRSDPVLREMFGKYLSNALR